MKSIKSKDIFSFGPITSVGCVFVLPTVSLCAAALIATVPFARAQAPVMTRNVREVVKFGQARMLNVLPATQTLKLSIALPLRNEAQLDAQLKALYDPNSSSFHQWLSVPEFTERFGPTVDDYEKVVQFAEANGFTVTGKPANRMLVDVQGSVASINQAFHVTMREYQHPTENRTFYAPDREPSLNLPVKIWHIAGLDDASPPRPRLRFAEAQTQLRTFQTGSGPGGQFLGSDMRAAYYGGTALTGAGQAIGLYGLDYNISDVQRYFSSVGQPFNPSVVQNYSTDGTVNTCGSGCDDGEPVIDIVQALSMAPGVTAVIEYFGSNDVDTFNAMASANAAKQLSASIGFLPADPSVDQPIFKEFAAQGQNLFASSDDSGAYSSSVPAYYPADDPYVVSTGGTDLVTNGAGGPWQSESSWVGSGGGISTNGLPIPSYQQLPGVINASNRGSTTLRNAPDVAMEANTDNWYCMNGKACQGGVGGTSLSAPRWAGFLALVNQQASQNGTSSVGFLNPTVYGIGVSSSYSADFHDITSGNNANSYASFNAVTGYDLITGWGSPKGQALINALAPPSGAKNLNGSHVVVPQNATGSRLDDNAASTAAGNKIQIWPANGTGAQTWVFNNVNVQPTGFYTIAVSLGPYCVTATDANSGSAVTLQPCKSASTQAWSAVLTGGHYAFHPANNTSLCLDVRYAGTAAGTVVQAYTCNGTPAQQWNLQ